MFIKCNECLHPLRIQDVCLPSAFYVIQGDGPPSASLNKCADEYMYRVLGVLYVCILDINGFFFFSFVFTTGRDQCAGYNATNRVIILLPTVCSYYYYYSGCCCIIGIGAYVCTYIKRDMCVCATVWITYTYDLHTQFTRHTQRCLYI